MVMSRELPGAPARGETLSTTSEVVCPPNIRRRLLVLTNDDTGIVIYLARSQSAAANAGIPLQPGASLIDKPDVFGRMYYGPWSAVAASGTPVLAISEE